MTDYSAERYNPEDKGFPQCGILTLAFDGLELTVKGAKKTYKYKAASGKAVSGHFSYTAERQAIPDVGPIPEGAYWIRPDELDDNAINCIVSSDFCAAWGRYRITIHPYAHTHTYKRGGFFIHGGSVRGSAGCIDLTEWMSDFVDDLTSEVMRANYLFKKCFIPLGVKYRPAP